MRAIFFMLAVGLLSGFLPCAIGAPVATDSGAIEGVVEGPVRIFKGIPYAAPPVGALRWQPPQPALPWAGVRRADAFSPICMQKGAYPVDSPPEPMSEDCLTLNVWAPAGAAAKLPVMVWIYGGGLENGSASTPLYAGDQFARRGVVLVTFNYRLGVFGFLAHPGLSKESGQARSGNYGLLDQIAALNWVHRNIAAFGGDPANVTIFGQSSGSISVSALTASPLTKGLFRRAIGESGGLFEPVDIDPTFALPGAETSGEHFANRVGAASIAALRQTSAEALLKVRFSPHFVIDGYALTKPPFDAYREGTQNDVDLLIGTNADEGQFFLDKTTVTVGNFNEVLGRDFPSWLVWLAAGEPGATDAEARATAAGFEGDMRFRWDMWAWARLASGAGRGRVFFYQFSRTPPFRKGDTYFGLRATHGVEMPYVFDHLDLQSVPWDEKDRALAKIVPAYWINFATTGDPNGPGLPRWPEFRDARDSVMVLGDEVGPQPIPDIERLQRIDQVYGTVRFVLAHPYTVIGIAAAIGLAVLTMLFLAVRRRPRG